VKGNRRIVVFYHKTDARQSPFFAKRPQRYAGQDDRLWRMPSNSFLLKAFPIE
jgi:hypothetical protein